MDELASALQWLLFFILFVIGVYIVARTASFGWYRSKFEHMRNVWKLMKGED